MRDYANELLIRVRELSRQETINDINKIIDSINELITNDQIISRTQKKFLSNAIQEIQKVIHLVEITKID